MNGNKQHNYRKSTVEKAIRVAAIVKRYYERGNHRRSLPMVWRMYVYPIYPISLRTVNSYLRMVSELEDPPREEHTRSLGPLFEVWDRERKPWTT